MSIYFAPNELCKGFPYLKVFTTGLIFSLKFWRHSLGKYLKHNRSLCPTVPTRLFFEIGKSFFGGKLFRTTCTVEPFTIRPGKVIK